MFVRPPTHRWDPIQIAASVYTETPPDCVLFSLQLMVTNCGEYWVLADIYGSLKGRLSYWHSTAKCALPFYQGRNNTNNNTEGEGRPSRVRNKHAFDMCCKPTSHCICSHLYVLYNQASTLCWTLSAITQDWTNYSLCCCISVVLMLRMIIKQNTEIVILTLFPRCPISFYIFDNTLPCKFPADRQSNFTQVWKVMENDIIQQPSCPRSVP